MIRAGIDEVGRGSLAGPVVACALVFQSDIDFSLIQSIKDSKKLSETKRILLAKELSKKSFLGLAATSVAIIDQINIRCATYLAMRRALTRLEKYCPYTIDEIIVDGNESPDDTDSRIRCLIKADAIVPEVSGAAIVAKVVRDDLMKRLDRRWPGYGWAKNVGYPVPSHKGSLLRLGPTPHHRRSFAPVRALLTL